MTKISMTVASVLMMIASAASAGTTVHLEDRSIAADGAGWLLAQLSADESKDGDPATDDREKVDPEEDVEPVKDDPEADKEILGPEEVGDTTLQPV